MADISTITLPNGSTYNIKDTTARNTGKVSGVKGSAESSYRTGDVNLTPANIGAANEIHKHYVNQIAQGQVGVAGNLDVFTQAIVGSAASNKSFGLPAEAITIEYSTNSGQTWTSYGASAAEKKALFAETRTNSFILGKSLSKSTNTLNNQLRVTIEPTDRYVSFNGLYVWMSTNGNSVTVDLERSTIGAKNTFTTVFTGQALSGWAGNNVRYFSGGTFGGGSDQTNNNYKYRLTFKQTAIHPDYNSAQIIDIRFYGLNVWSIPNNMVSKNHLYSWDADLNATFPNKVTANGGFVGNLNGTAGKADWATNLSAFSGNEVIIGGSSGTATNETVWINYRDKNGGSVSSEATQITTYNFGNRKGNTNGVTVKAETFNGNLTGKVNNHTVNADVPSGAKFTDTTYTANTSKLVTTTVPNVTSVGSAPTLGTAIAADDITSWTSNTPTTFTISGEKLTITPGSSAILSYTARSIPNVTSVGSAPTLGTAVTVATGSLASNGSGASIATGITAS